MVKLLTLAVVVSGLVAEASAQPSPYGDIAAPLCYLNPYTVQSNCRDGQYPLLTTFGSRLGIGETVIGAPGRELGWLIVVNPDPEPQEILIEVIKSGDTVSILEDGTPRQQSYVHRATVPGKGSYEWDLRGDPLFYRGRHVFRAVVYFQRAGTAHTVTRPLDEVDRWRIETIREGATIQAVNR